MRPLNPRHRYEALQGRCRAPENEHERSLYVILHGSAALNQVCPLRPWDSSCLLDPCVEYPYQVYQMDSVRAVLESFLLASKEDFPISEALEMPPEEVGIYRDLFFDTSVFRTQLERIVFLRQIPEEHPYKSLYSIALRQGLGALQWHFCQNKGLIEPNEVLKSIMTDSYFRSLEHRGLPTTGKLAREAAKYAKISIECARALIHKSETVDESTESLRVQFEKVRQNRTIDDLRSEVGLDKVVH